MPARKPEELAPRERVWQVVWWLARGEKLSSETLRRTTVLSSRGVRKLMLKMSWVLPIYRHRGKWRAVLDENDEED